MVRTKTTGAHLKEQIQTFVLQTFFFCLNATKPCSYLKFGVSLCGHTKVSDNHKDIYPEIQDQWLILHFFENGERRNFDFFDLPTLKVKKTENTRIRNFRTCPKTLRCIEYNGNLNGMKGNQLLRNGFVNNF